MGIAAEISDDSAMADLQRRLWQAEKLLADVEPRLTHAMSQGNDVTALLEEHNVRLESIRTKMDSQGYHAALEERARSDLEYRLERVRSDAEQVASDCITFLEQAQKRFDGLALRQDELTMALLDLGPSGEVAGEEEH